MPTKLRYRDCNEYLGHSGVYLSTNEETPLFVEMLKGVEVDRAAGIASGGEIGLLVLLPHVRRELVLVDHNYQTLSYAVMKWLLMRHLGVKEAHRLLSADNGELEGHVKKLVKHLPEKMKKFYTRPSSKSHSGYNDYQYSRFCSNLGPNYGTRREWGKFKVEDIEVIESRLNKVQFLHGDIVADLKRRRPFDLLYLSNAMEYAGRAGRLTAKQISPLVKPGGIVLSTACGISAQSTGFNKHIVSEKSVGYGIGWRHKMSRIPEASVVPV